MPSSTSRWRPRASPRARPAADGRICAGRGRPSGDRMALPDRPGRMRKVHLRRACADITRSERLIQRKDTGFGFGFGGARRCPLGAPGFAASGASILLTVRSPGTPPRANPRYPERCRTLASELLSLHRGTPRLGADRTISPASNRRRPGTDGRGSSIRTNDLQYPKLPRYQAALYPDLLVADVLHAHGAPSKALLSRSRLRRAAARPQPEAAAFRSRDLFVEDALSARTSRASRSSGWISAAIMPLEPGP